MNKKAKLIVFILSFLLIVYFIYASKEQLSILNELSLIELFILILPPVFTILLQSVQLRGILRTVKKDINKTAVLAITSLTTLYNNIIPMSGGAAIRGVLFKRKFKIEWSAVASVMGAYYLLSYLAMGLALVTASSFAFSISDINGKLYAATLLFFGAILSITGLLYFSNIKFKLEGRLFNFIKNSIQGIRKLKNHPVLQLNIIGLQVIIVFILAIKLYLCFIFLGIEVSFWKVVAVEAFVVFSLVISISPGDLGIQEGLFVLFSSFLNTTPETVLIAALLFRVTNLVAIVITGLLGKLWLIKN